MKFNKYVNRPVSIKSVTFSALDPDDIEKLGIVEVTVKDLYDKQSHTSVLNGPLDPRLGVSRKGAICMTCQGDVQTCPGHFGFYRLMLPVFHPGYFKVVYEILQSICKECGRALVGPDREVIARSSDMRATSKPCGIMKKNKKCLYCGSIQGKLKKGNGLKLLYCRRGMESAEDFNPLKVINLFKLIPPEDYAYLGIRQRPTNFITTHVLIPPNNVRPSVIVDHDGGSNEDDLTVKISEIIHSDQILVNSVTKGNPLHLIYEDWDFLQAQFTSLIDSDEHRGILQRLKGKHGRFRGNLSGKRVDFSGRTVISPDPNLSVEDVGVPRWMAQVLTIPERVTDFNISRMKKLVLKGSNYLLKKSDVDSSEQIKIFLKYGNRKRESENLKVGDVVERHLHDGDTILFNRQPSLHRVSIMAHKVRVHDDRTLKFNECVCAPYNADFDGDEMNIHCLQTVECSVEAMNLMSIKENLISPKNGEPLIGATQDFITGAFLLTSKDCFLSPAEFGSLSVLLNTGRVAPAVLWPCVSYSGKQVVSAILSDVHSKVILKSHPPEHAKISYVARNKSYVSDTDMNDGLVLIRENNLLLGRLDKSIIGVGCAKTSLLYYMIGIRKDYGTLFLNNISKVTSRFLIRYGFSIGLDDLTMSFEKDRVVRSGLYRIMNLNRMLLHADDEDMETKSVLGEIRDTAGNLCVRKLGNNNAAIIMCNCGSKGSRISISQMVAMVGQQIISGSRIPNGFVGRTLPHYPGELGRSTSVGVQKLGGASSKDLGRNIQVHGIDDVPEDMYSARMMEVESKGFVSSSFRSGLKSSEFFFHAVSGREGLVDTAVKTSETGYMQRRLMKALEDLNVEYDGTVRGSDRVIVQFEYGEDGVDPMSLVGTVGAPGNRGAMKIEAGTCVGALAGQSIGEPGTQMTLKTFHTAGISSMCITSGVPRLKEIINAVKNISTPVIVVDTLDGTLMSAKVVKGRVEKVCLRDVIRSVTEIYSEKGLGLVIKVVKKSPFDGSKSTFEPAEMERIVRRVERRMSGWTATSKGDEIIMWADPSHIKSFMIEKAKRDLKNILLSDIPGVKNVSVFKEGDAYRVLVEGVGIRSIMGVDGVDGCNVITNNVMEIESALGVEAARRSVINEMQSIFKSYGIKIDIRHIMLLSDTMCHRGSVLGITRFGIRKMKVSTLMLASFEQTGEHLFDAAVRKSVDKLSGVSESIIIGKPISIGTGKVELYHKM